MLPPKTDKEKASSMHWILLFDLYFDNFFDASSATAFVNPCQNSTFTFTIYIKRQKVSV